MEIEEIFLLMLIVWNGFRHSLHCGHDAALRSIHHLFLKCSALCMSSMLVMVSYKEDKVRVLWSADFPNRRLGCPHTQKPNLMEKSAS